MIIINVTFAEAIASPNQAPRATMCLCEPCDRVSRWNLQKQVTLSANQMIPDDKKDLMKNMI